MHWVAKGLHCEEFKDYTETGRYNYLNYEYGAQKELS